MNKEELQALAKVAAKNLKTEQDLNEFSEMLTKSRLRRHSMLSWTII